MQETQFIYLFFFIYTNVGTRPQNVLIQVCKIPFSKHILRMSYKISFTFLMQSENINDRVLGYHARSLVLFLTLPPRPPPPLSLMHLHMY